MKYTGSCPKCGSKDLLRVKGSVGPYGRGNHISLGTLRFFSDVVVHRYLCCNCGYSEEWLDEEGIRRLKEEADGFVPSELVSRPGRKEDHNEPK